jgi:hypothetical protein
MIVRQHRGFLGPVVARYDSRGGIRGLYRAIRLLTAPVWFAYLKFHR